MAVEHGHLVDPRHLPDPIFTIDSESRVVIANPAACALLGATEATVIGMRLAARLSDGGRAALGLLMGCARQGRVVEEMLDLRCESDRIPRHFLARTMPDASHAGGPLVTLLLRDQTERDRLAEEGHRRAHLERTPGQFVLTLDAMGRIEHAVGLDSVLGYSPRAWIGGALSDLLPDADGATPLRARIHGELVEVGRWTARQHCARSDGTTVLVQLFATPRVDPVTHGPAGFYLSGVTIASRAGTPASVTSISDERERRMHTPIDTAVIPAAPRTGKPAVLVADDDPTMRAVVRHQLERGGYDVIEAASGRAALDQLRTGAAPHFLVADLRMAEGSGGWLIAQVGYEFPALLSRTLIISGDPASAAAAHVTARWRCPVLAKPFNGAQLVSTLVGLTNGAADVA